MDFPYFFEGVGDNPSVDTNQSSSSSGHILPQHTRSENQYQATPTANSSTYQQDALWPLDSRGPQPQPPSLPWNAPLQSQPVHTSNTLSFPPAAILSGPPTHTITSDSSYLPQSTSSLSHVPADYRAYSAEGDWRQFSIMSDQNLSNPAPFDPLSHFDQFLGATTPPSVHLNCHSQYLEHHTGAPEYGSQCHENINEDINNLNADQLALISQLLTSERVKGKQGVNYLDDFDPRAYQAANPQLAALQSQSGSIENGHTQLFQDLSTTSQPGLTEVPHHQPSLPSRTNPQVARLHQVATQTPEMSSSNQISLFSGSHSFAMHQPIFNVHPPATGSQQLEQSGAMKWLRASVIKHAQHDSAGRDPPPRCHPDTRISILERTHKWIDDPQRQKQLLWIRGPAGVGKSAIVQTVADSLSVSGRLIASLFFSRPNGRSNPQQVFPTIAYQLASRDAAYRAYIETIRPPDSPPLEAKAMKEQFRLLIVDPLVKHKLFAKGSDILIAIDGLDECDGDPGADDYDPTCHRHRTFKEVHREIVELISGLVKAHPSIPAIWVIASRPESHITAVFGSDDVKGSYVEESILIDDKEACADVEKFLVASFKKIAEAYPDHITKTPWPTYDHFLQIAKAASGLFIFGEVVIRFINDPREENPISQLNQVLVAVAKLRQSRKNKNPLGALDVIYTAILFRIPSTRMENLKKILPLMIYVHRKSIQVGKYNFQNMYQHFDISREDAVTSFNYLHSVIYFPRVKNIGETQPRFYHASFRDYLEDPSRSCEYTVEKWSEDLTWPPPAAIAATSWVHTLLEGLSSSGSVVKVLIHQYKISDSGLLQAILEGLNFRSLLMEKLASFRDLHQVVATKVCSHL
ncbi:hypothetical protein NP233_g315 [Leucocoprinus birnbaumii]|uniref:Nephrocystin 3-like N-terminal domain-containing protein n=1 Tax=Leucocoprinus birnbaumii TaxID=56174 RepID=A0AAD5W358_9AGAR|nr:hypothetical protein NP233_g315 [Leucocoprinus birnbaumii]